MMEAPLAVIKRSTQLDTVATPVVDTLRATLKRAPAIKDALHGVWLGHPLHAVLTDIPVGAWSTAILLDAADALPHQNGYSRAADTAIAIGLVGAAGAAVTGMTDWSETDGGSRRVGMVHGLINVAATSFFAVSLLQRRAGRRAAGRRASVVGYLFAMAGAYLGGHLVYEDQIGVDRSAHQELPDTFTRVLRLEELPENEPKTVHLDKTPVVMVRRGDTVSALIGICSHAAGPLGEGKVVGDTIECPWHGSRFSLHDGSVCQGPSVHPQPLVHTRVVDGWVEARQA
jgi:nitrite reductase/ring-hydroxylating ferredoxin subunit/uncharacterized membrane protein